MNVPPGSMHCVGDAYYISPDEIDNPEWREKKIMDNISQYYKFFTPRKFTNTVDCEIVPNLPKDTTIGDYFSNSVIIIDEAHNLTRMEEEESKEDKTSDDRVTNKIGEHCVEIERKNPRGSKREKTVMRQSDRKSGKMLNSCPIRLCQSRFFRF